MHSTINSLKDNLKIVTKHSSNSIIESTAELTEIEFHIYVPVSGGKKKKESIEKLKLEKKDVEL